MCDVDRNGHVVKLRDDTGQLIWAARANCRLEHADTFSDEPAWHRQTFSTPRPRSSPYRGSVQFAWRRT